MGSTLQIQRFYNTQNTTFYLLNSRQIILIQSVFDIATGYELDDPRFESRHGRNSYFPHNVHTGSVVHPAFYSNGTGFLFQGMDEA
jgi:hypothetical protein